MTTTAHAPLTSVAPARPAVASRIEDLVGSTPLLELRLRDLAPGARVLAKLESANPMSSSKDRAALYMLRAAEERGALRPGGTVIEATSGNTGISLAAFAASRGYRCVIVLPDNATAERVRLLRAFGAEIVQTPSSLGYPGAIAEAKRLHAATPDSWFPCQHENPDNVRAHYETTGPEIQAAVSSLGRRIAAFVCGVGTGGAHRCRPRPQASTIGRTRDSGRAREVPHPVEGYAGQHRIPGLNGGFVADTTDVSLIDEVVTVSDEDALLTARRLTTGQGLFSGVSSGAAAYAPVSASPEGRSSPTASW